MAVYMDPPFRAGAGSMNRMWCHMWADTEDELQAMARRLGLKRAWHQGPHNKSAAWSHYDICSNAIRARALKLGVILTDKYGPAEHNAKINWNGYMLDMIQKAREKKE